MAAQRAIFMLSLLACSGIVECFGPAEDCTINGAPITTCDECLKANCQFFGSAASGGTCFKYCMITDGPPCASKNTKGGCDGYAEYQKNEQICGKQTECGACVSAEVGKVYNDRGCGWQATGQGTGFCMYGCGMMGCGSTECPTTIS
eukprot:m.340025 g.340025  ORF g.340025 m.340025 type:complete len:147 (-) comp19086_c0_seq1:104-544(-)